MSFSPPENLRDTLALLDRLLPVPTTEVFSDVVVKAKQFLELLRINPTNENISIVIVERYNGLQLRIASGPSILRTISVTPVISERYMKAYFDPLLSVSAASSTQVIETEVLDYLKNILKINLRAEPLLSTAVTSRSDVDVINVLAGKNTENSWKLINSILSIYTPRSGNLDQYRELLYMAASGANFEQAQLVVKKLLMAGIETSFRGPQGLCALHLLVERNQSDLIGIALKKSPELITKIYSGANENIVSPFSFAIINQYVIGTTLQYLLDFQSRHNFQIDDIANALREVIPEQMDKTALIIDSLVRNKALRESFKRTPNRVKAIIKKLAECNRLDLIEKMFNCLPPSSFDVTNSQEIYAAGLTLAASTVLAKVPPLGNTPKTLVERMLETGMSVFSPVPVLTDGYFSQSPTALHFFIKHNQINLIQTAKLISLQSELSKEYLGGQWEDPLNDEMQNPAVEIGTLHCLLHFRSEYKIPIDIRESSLCNIIRTNQIDRMLFLIEQGIHLPYYYVTAPFSAVTNKNDIFKMIKADWDKFSHEFPGLRPNCFRDIDFVLGWLEQAYRANKDTTNLGKFLVVQLKKIGDGAEFDSLSPKRQTMFSCFQELFIRFLTVNERHAAIQNYATEAQNIPRFDMKLLAEELNKFSPSNVLIATNTSCLFAHPSAAPSAPISQETIYSYIITLKMYLFSWNRASHDISGTRPPLFRNEIDPLIKIILENHDDNCEVIKSTLDTLRVIVSDSKNTTILSSDHGRDTLFQQLKTVLPNICVNLGVSVAEEMRLITSSAPTPTSSS